VVVILVPSVLYMPWLGMIAEAAADPVALPNIA
jgi:hypothetical protein